MCNCKPEWTVRASNFFEPSNCFGFADWFSDKENAEKVYMAVIETGKYREVLIEEVTCIKHYEAEENEK